LVWTVELARNFVAAALEGWDSLKTAEEEGRAWAFLEEEEGRQIGNPSAAEDPVLINLVVEEEEGWEMTKAVEAEYQPLGERWMEPPLSRHLQWGTTAVSYILRALDLSRSGAS